MEGNTPDPHLVATTGETVHAVAFLGKWIRPVVFSLGPSDQVRTMDQERFLPKRGGVGIESMEKTEEDLRVLLAPLVEAAWKTLGINRDYASEWSSSLMGELSREDRPLGIELFRDKTIDVYSYSSGYEPDPGGGGSPPDSISG